MHAVRQGDVVVVLSARGTTRYALAFAKAATADGATLVAIANNPGAVLLHLADISICLETPSEVIAGSTRLGAGTAQNAALNLMSSMMAIKLGHLYQGHLVNLVADDAKLLWREIGMVSQIAKVSKSDATAALN